MPMGLRLNCRNARKGGASDKKKSGRGVSAANGLLSGRAHRANDMQQEVVALAEGNSSSNADTEVTNVRDITTGATARRPGNSGTPAAAAAAAVWSDISSSGHSHKTEMMAGTRNSIGYDFASTPPITNAIKEDDSSYGRAKSPSLHDSNRLGEETGADTVLNNSKNYRSPSAEICQNAVIRSLRSASDTFPHETGYSSKAMITRRHQNEASTHSCTVSCRRRVEDCRVTGKGAEAAAREIVEPGAWEARQKDRLGSTIAGEEAATAAAAAVGGAAVRRGNDREAVDGSAGDVVYYAIPEQAPPAVRIVLGGRPRWTEWDAVIHAPDEWNFQWRSSRFKPSEYREARGSQRINHFPRSSLITRKDLLLRVLRKMKAVHGSVYAFHPDSYLLPTEYTKFVEAFTRPRQQQQQQQQRRGRRLGKGTLSEGATNTPSPVPPDDSPWLTNTLMADAKTYQATTKRITKTYRYSSGGGGCGNKNGELRRAEQTSKNNRDAGDGCADWIVKPCGSSRGRGVYLLRDLGELAYDQLSIVQRYISDPLTVGGYKADFRLYAVVTSLHPMTVLLYEDGIVRFATSKYDASSHRDVFGHLTNSSINRNSPFASRDKDVIGGGCKWTLRRLRTWVEDSFNDGAERWARLWAKIRSMVCLSVLPLVDVVPGGPGHSSCFELFGFDIMVDSKLSRAYLLEVNCSPALGLEEESDRQVKLPLMEDLLNLLDVESASCITQKRSGKCSRSSNLSRKPSDDQEGSQVGRQRQRQWQRQRQCQDPQKRSSPPQEKMVSSSIQGSDAFLCPRPFASGATPPFSTPAASGHGFETVFPFSDESADHARRLSDIARADQGREDAKAQGRWCIRAIVAEIKAHERKCIAGLRLNTKRRSHGEEGESRVASDDASHTAAAATVVAAADF